MWAMQLDPSCLASRLKLMLCLWVSCLFRFTRASSFLLLFVVAGLSFGRAHAAEEVLRFEALIEVQSDNSLVVTETIRVRAEGDQIRRGIFRDFSVPYAANRGPLVPAIFEVEWVRRNGTPEPFTLLMEQSAIRLRIGQSDAFLPVPSVQEYTYRYRIADQVRSGFGPKSLHWNITGIWTLPILTASVEVHVPKGEQVQEPFLYTGAPGEWDDSYRVATLGQGSFLALTTEPLLPGQHFSMYVDWSGGNSSRPPPASRLRPIPRPSPSDMESDGLTLSIDMGAIRPIPRPVIGADTPRGRPAAIDTPSFSPVPSKPKQVVVPATFRGGTYEIPVRLNGVIELDFVLDSGASVVFIPSDVATVLARAGTLDNSSILEVKPYVLADGSIVERLSILLEKVEIGGLVLYGVEAAIGESNSPLLLGQSFLKSFRSWSIDNERRQVVLVPQ